MTISEKQEAVTTLEGQAIFEEIAQKRQHRTKTQRLVNLSDQYNSQNDWVAFICTFAGRATDNIVNNTNGFRENMLKVAALAVAAIEAHDKDWC